MKQSADYNFLLEFLILPSTGRLNRPVTPRANLSCVVATIFSSVAFLSLSVSMANLSRLVAASFSSLALLASSVFMANLNCLLATTFSSLVFSLTHFHHLASIFCEWIGTVSRGILFLTTFSFLFFSSCTFLVLLAVSFSHLMLSLSFLCSSMYNALFVFFGFFFIHAKAALAYSRNE